MHSRSLDFAAINRAALARIEGLLPWLTPQGCMRGNEWVALNPTRNDRKPGSFSINTLTGMWCDFATGDKGSDVVSYCAYVKEVSQYEAALMLSDALGGGHA